MDITLAPWSPECDWPEDAMPMVAHRPDCPVVDRLRAEGKPLMTLFSCQHSPRDLGVPCHACLEAE